MGDNDNAWIDRLPPLERDVARRELRIGDGLDDDDYRDVWRELFVSIVPHCAAGVDLCERRVAMSAARRAENLADAALVVMKSREDRFREGGSFDARSFWTRDWDVVRRSLDAEVCAASVVKPVVTGGIPGVDDDVSFCDEWTVQDCPIREHDIRRGDIEAILDNTMGAMRDATVNPDPLIGTEWEALRK